MSHYIILTNKPSILFELLNDYFIEQEKEKVLCILQSIEKAHQLFDIFTKKNYKTLKYLNNENTQKYYICSIKI